MKRLGALLLLAFVLGGAILYNVWARNTPPNLPRASGEASGPQDALTVTVTTPRRAVSQQSLTLIGALRANQQATITSKVPARIDAVLVQNGQKVLRGQSLVRLDMGDTAAQMSSARAGVQAAEAQYRKAVDGRQARTVEMDAQISQAEGGLKTALAKQRQAELAITLNDSSAASDAERASAAVRQAESGLKQAETGLTQAQDTLKRVRFLYEHGGVARADLEGAQAQADIAQAQRDSALAALDQARAALKPASETMPLRRKVSEADLEAARAGVKQAQDGVRNSHRAKTQALHIADRDIESARAQVTQARAGQAQAAVQIGGATLNSPFDGIVTEVNAHTGEFAQPGQPLMKVIAPGSVYLEVSAPARDADALRAGLAARVTLETMPDRPLEGEVTEVLPLAEADGHSIPVHIQLKTNRIRLSAGVAAKAVIFLAQGAAPLTVPLEAVRSEDDSIFVYVAEEGKAQRRSVTIGAGEGKEAQILSGLVGTEQVILSAPASLREGMAVKMTEATR